MKRLIAAFMATVLLVCAGCGISQTTKEQEQTRTFVDSCGREVEVPATITKVAVSGPAAQIVLFALAPELLVGISSQWSEAALEYIPETYASLPVLGQLYGGKGDLNPEALLSSGAQVVIDIGETKDGIDQDMDQLQQQTGIPFVHISMTLSELPETYEMLGTLLERQEAAAELSTYCGQVYDRAVELSGSVEKVKCLYLLGDTGCNVIAQGSYHSEVLDLLTDNQAVVDSPSSKGTGNEVSMEQILLWDPEYILFAPDSIYDSVGDDPLWQQLTAIRTGQYSRVPEGPYNWMGFPPSAQRLLGMLWLGWILYPDDCDYDLYEEVRQYFELFYHVDLSQEQFEKLTG